MKEEGVVPKAYGRGGKKGWHEFVSSIPCRYSFWVKYSYELQLVLIPAYLVNESLPIEVHHTRFTYHVNLRTREREQFTWRLLLKKDDNQLKWNKRIPFSWLLLCQILCLFTPTLPVSECRHINHSHPPLVAVYTLQVPFGVFVSHPHLNIHNQTRRLYLRKYHS